MKHCYEEESWIQMIILFILKTLFERKSVWFCCSVIDWAQHNITSLSSFDLYYANLRPMKAILHSESLVLVKNIRAGWVMPGVASPPLKFFFRNYPPPENFWIHLGPKTIPWDTFQAFQVYPATPGNCQVYPGVSRCIQKKIFPAEGRKNFFLTGWAGPPLKNFFRKKKFFFSHLYLFMLE